MTALSPGTDSRSDETVFDSCLRGESARLRRADGGVIPLRVRRWRSVRDRTDRQIINRCVGPTIDLGCGPGRFTSALAARGIPVLGVDRSTEAVEQTIAGGGYAIRRDIRGSLPGEGRWHHALLLDGNIGIGGDPSALLARVRRLVRPGGSVLVETAGAGGAVWSGAVRVEGRRTAGEWFPWATVESAALMRMAAAVGFGGVSVSVSGRRRHLVELRAGGGA